MSGTDLSIRSERRVLPARGETSRWQLLLAADGAGDAWRIIEALSEKGQPFELELRWSAATAGGAWVKATVSHASRICVFARSLQLRAANLSSAINPVRVTVADGFAPTANGWEHREHCEAEGRVEVTIPPFARTYQLHLAERGALAGTEITLLDGTGTARARFSAANQPSGGIPIGGASRVVITSQEATELRGIFQLVL